MTFSVSKLTSFSFRHCLSRGSFYVWFERGVGKYGVDFLGGHEIVAQINADTTSDDIRKVLAESGVEEADVQSFEPSSRQYGIRLNTARDPKEVKEKVSAALEKGFGKNFEIIKTDYVGPSVGEDLRTRALWAIGLGLAGILAFVAFRFEFAFALGAVVAIFHDVIVATGVYLLAGHLLNMATLAAALTILGYSVNDTIVIFHRVREELDNPRGRTLSALVNDSINITLVRTMITHALTMFAVLALLIFGTGELKDLSLFLFAGIIAGSYSTIYIASPVMIAWHKFRGGTEAV